MLGLAVRYWYWGGGYSGVWVLCGLCSHHTVYLMSAVLDRHLRGNLRGKLRVLEVLQQAAHVEGR